MEAPPLAFRRGRDAWAERIARRKRLPTKSFAGGAQQGPAPPHWLTLGRVSPLVCAYAIVSAVGVHQCADIGPAQRMLSQRVERSPTVSSGWLWEQALPTLVHHSPWLPSGYFTPAQPPLLVNSPGEKTNLTQKQPCSNLDRFTLSQIAVHAATRRRRGHHRCQPCGDAVRAPARAASSACALARARGLCHWRERWYVRHVGWPRWYCRAGLKTTDGQTVCSRCLWMA